MPTIVASLSIRDKYPMFRWLGMVAWVVSCQSAVADDVPSESLVGLWGCEHVFGPEIRGELTLVRDGSRWHVEIAGFQASIAADGARIHMVLPADRGEFRGRIESDGTGIQGHWVQPATVFDGYRYATPVVLKRKGVAAWHGTVAPLEDRLTLYLVIERRNDGTLGAFVRNPERNIGMILPIGEVLVSSGAVRLTDRRGGEDLLTGRYAEASGTLSLYLSRYRTTFDFTRRGRDQATGFYPRTSRFEKYEYRRPTADDDGWATASLGEVGLDAQPIGALVDRILQTGTTNVASPAIHALLIARKGKLVLEEYFYGYHKDHVHDTRSASKSLISALVGIAMGQGTRFDVSASVCSLFPQYADLQHDEPRKRTIRIEHLLTMSSGLACDDNDEDSVGNEDRMQEQSEQPDWYKYTLDLPMVRDPGARAVYGSAQINLLGGIIAGSANYWLPEFILDHFAAPLDIRRYHVNLMPNGQAYGGGGVYMRPRDFLKLGQLFLTVGEWNGRRVVDPKWVEQSTRPHASINRQDDYGYAWWLRDYSIGASQYSGFYASGNGGQLLIVIPKLELVVVFAAGNYNNYPTWSKFHDELLPQYILPAVQSE